MGALPTWPVVSGQCFELLLGCPTGGSSCRSSCQGGVEIRWHSCGLPAQLWEFLTVADWVNLWDRIHVCCVFSSVPVCFVYLVQFLPVCCPPCDECLLQGVRWQLLPWVLPGGPVGMSVVGPSGGRGSLQFFLRCVWNIKRIILFWEKKKAPSENYIHEGFLHNKPHLWLFLEASCKLISFGHSSALVKWLSLM